MRVHAGVLSKQCCPPFCCFSQWILSFRQPHPDLTFSNSISSSPAGKEWDLRWHFDWDPLTCQWMGECCVCQAVSAVCRQINCADCDFQWGISPKKTVWHLNFWAANAKMRGGSVIDVLFVERERVGWPKLKPYPNPRACTCNLSQLETPIAECCQPSNQPLSNQITSSQLGVPTTNNRPASMPAIPSTHQSANLPGETVSKLYKFAWEPVGLANLLCDLHFFVALFFMFRCSSANSLLTAANCAKLASDCGKFQSGTGL